MKFQSVVNAVAALKKAHVINAYGMALFLNMLRKSKMLKKLFILAKSKSNKPSQRDAFRPLLAGVKRQVVGATITDYGR